VAGRNAALVIVDRLKLFPSPAGHVEFWSEGESLRAGLNFGCPCGCGATGAITFDRGDGRGWTVTGEWPKASLQPSIGFWSDAKRGDGYHWHGYLREGVFEEC
jgi:hypothetical protein